MFKKNISFALCASLVCALLFTGCAHPWRLAQNPNPAPVFVEEPIEDTSMEPLSTADDFETENPSEEPAIDPSNDPEQDESTDAPETEIPNDDEPVTEQPTDSQPSVTDAPAGAPTNTPSGASTTAPAIPTNTPTGTHTGTPTNSLAPTPTKNPTASPTHAPTSTPKPTATPTPKPTATPKPAADIPDFSSKAINGSQATYTNSFLYGNKLTMVNVWATTCGPCIQEMPHFPQLESKYGSRGFKILSVLGDSEKPGCIPTGLNILKSIPGFSIPVIRNNASVAAAFPAGAYPMTYFIDSNGNILKVVAASNSFEGWCGIIDNLLP